jgi:hypothetical protein
MAYIACTKSTETIRMWKKKNSGVCKCGRAQEQKCTVEEWCIEGIWCIEHKRQKNIKCKGCAEDTDADKAEQCNRTTTRLVRH